MSQPSKLKEMTMAMPSARAIPDNPATLTNKAANILERLDRAIDSARNIVDRLHGPRPREAGATNAVAPAAMPSIDRYLDLMQERMLEIEEELSRANSGI